MTCPAAQKRAPALIAMLLAAAATMQAAGPENVLVVVNRNSPLSRSIAEYYTRRRSIPATNVCSIAASVDETVSRAAFDSTIAAPVGACLTSRRLTEAILYIVTTQGVPLRIEGTTGLSGTAAAVDSELTLLYRTLHGGKVDIAQSVPNPFFRQQDATFRHPQFRCISSRGWLRTTSRE